jgi:hypothetical protein
MQVKANFLVTFLDGELEKGQENAFDSKEEGKKDGFESGSGA